MSVPPTTKFPVPLGPFDLIPQELTVGAGRIRLSQQYAEIVESGGTNKIRLSQQYAEIVESGGNNKIRLSQQYAEIVHTFGTPPLKGNGKGSGGGSPGQQKKNQSVAEYQMFTRRLQRTRGNRPTNSVEDSVALLQPAYLPQPQPLGRLRVKTVKQIIHIS